MYGTKIRRSIWITSPSGIQNISNMNIPSPMGFVMPYKNDDIDYLDRLTPNFHRQPEILPPHKSHVKSHKHKSHITPDRKEPVQKSEDMPRNSVYNAIFGAGIGRIVIYTVFAMLFVAIGYMIRKREDYGSYVRLPSEEP